MTPGSRTLAGVDDTTVDVGVSRPDGWDLLKAVDQVPAWDQAYLLAAVAPLKQLSSGEWKTNDPPALHAMAEVAKALVPCVLDEAAYMTFASGSGALERVVNLATEFVSEVL